MISWLTRRSQCPDAPAAWELLFVLLMAIWQSRSVFKALEVP